MALLPVVLGPDGMIPVQPADLHAQLLASVALLAPGYEGRLPGSLVEDITSTDVGAIVICDQARVEVVNSLTPRGANAFLLNQLGQMYGVVPGIATNTSCFVVFHGPVGYVVGKGFVVSDGSNQFTLPDGGIVQTGGATLPLFAVSTTPGSFSVPANTVVNVVTSVPSTVVLTVTNPLDGTPAVDAETETTYRERVLTAGLATAQGSPRFLKTLLGNVPGVVYRLVSVRQVGTNWEVICGGSGDPYQIAYAIFQGIFDIASLVGSVTTARNVSVTIDDYPDTYVIPFVVPPLQTVGLAVTWNTNSPNFVSPVGVAQLAIPPLAEYINSIIVGRPINILDLEETFRRSIETILPRQYITRLVFNVTINGVVTPAPVGTTIVSGDPESFFSISQANITVTQG
jgi:hypothetical protein